MLTVIKEPDNYKMAINKKKTFMYTMSKAIKYFKYLYQSVYKII